MNLRSVRKKIKSFQNVKKITKAMQMVSSVKMRKAQKVAVDGRPYREQLEKVIRRVATAGDMRESTFVKTDNSQAKKQVVVFITSNKGLAGNFLTSLDRYVLRKIDYDTTEFITIGSKGGQFLAITKGKITADYSSQHPELAVGSIFEYLKNLWLSNEYTQITILHNKFISTLKFETRNDVILPVSVENLKATEAERSEAIANATKEHSFEEATQAKNIPYTIEPLSKELIDSLLESYIEEKLRGAILNSLAAEHSARMIAMKNATDNATDLIYNLTLEGNKLRQEAITNELLDMITAKESVESA